MDWQTVAAAGQFNQSYDAGCGALEAGSYREAETHLLSAVAKAERFESTDPRLAAALSRLARTYTRMGRQELAEPLHQRVLAIRRAAVGEQSPELAESLNGLAAAARARGDRAAFSALALRAVNLQSPSCLDPATLVESLRLVAAAAMDQGGPERAEATLQRALEVSHRSFAAVNPATADTIAAMGRLYFDTGRVEQAIDCLETAADSRRLCSSPDHPALADVLHNLAAAYQHQRRYDDARRIWEEVLRIREKALGLDHPSLIPALHDLALVHRELGNWDEAEPLFRRALALAEKHLRSDYKIGAILHNYGSLLMARKRYEYAEPLCRRVLPVFRATFGAEHQGTAAAQFNLAACCYHLGKLDEADALMRQVIAALERNPEISPGDLPAMLEYRAAILEAAGRDSEAANCLARATALRSATAWPLPDK